MNRSKPKSRKRSVLTKAPKKTSKTETVAVPETEPSEEPTVPDSDAEIEESKEDEPVATPTTRKRKVQDVKPTASSSKKPTAAPQPKPKNKSILQLRVTLSDITPPIWRRIQVSNTDTFYDLHQHIKEAMGWITPRFHQFIVTNPKTNKNIMIVDGDSAVAPYDFDKERGRLLKERDTKVSRFFSSVGDMVLFEYDVADCWMHEVVLEKVLPPPGPKAEYPKCTGGKRACPPEECGGVGGYQNLVEAIKDPAHAEHQDMVDWIEDQSPGFDPEKFDRKAVFRRVRMWVQM